MLTPGQDLLGLLTPRERQVVASVAAGLTNKRIAEELGVTTSTVEAFVNRVCIKIGLRGDDTDVNRRVYLALLYLTDPNVNADNR